MPQLPSGRKVGLCADPVLDIARKGDFSLSLAFKVSVTSRADITPLVNIVYFEPRAGVPEPGKPYLSGLMLSDIGTSKCDWSVEDVAAFEEWLQGEQNKQWMQRTFDELRELIRTIKPPLPDSLKGIGEADD